MFSDEQFNTLIQLIKDMINDKDKLTITIVLLVISAGILYVLVTNLLIPCLLNISNRKNEVTKSKIERKLSVIENTLEKLKIINLQLNNIESNKTKITESIAYIRKFIYLHAYQIPKKMKIEIDSLLNYFQQVVENPLSRKTTTEDKLFQNIYKYYETLK